MKKENDNDNLIKEYKVVKEKRSGNKVYSTIMLVLVVALITFMITTVVIFKFFVKKEDKDSLALNAFVSKNDENSETDMTTILEQYKKIIDKYYIGDIDEKSLENGAIKGYIEGLNDPYTKYISSEEMKDYTEDIEGEFVGIGVYITANEENDRVQILVPIKGGAAEQAGIQAGDLIKAVNDKEYTAKDVSEISNILKGEEGSEVKVDIIRGNENLTFNIKRTNVIVNPVSAEVLENNIGYIEFASFDKNTSREVKAKYEELEAKGITSLIIDLRNNGGGIVDQAVEIAGLALDKDSTVLYEINKDKEEKEMKTQTDPIIKVPIVVLVNKNTGSSSEILAGALQDFKKAKIVGEVTYGKGVIQTLLSLPDGSGLKVTSAEYLTPNKNKINKIGVKPDIEVKLPDDENSIIVERSKDTQLQKAIEVLKGE